MNFILKGCFLQNVVTIGGVVRCFGIFYVAFMEEINSKAGNAAWIAVFCGLVLNIGGKIFSPKILKSFARLEERRVMYFLTHRDSA